eukprot:TRINITY_DN90902_c0_g1_i1.p1 TRINITY_DN90902_c0_g1~~TRINITY_DN90902_c0_g1_i1.p1  ORF type:complete len:309 (+),score=38.92 TRINITY_DN90902_c0_g1_i1:33-959(+)
MQMRNRPASAGALACRRRDPHAKVRDEAHAFHKRQKSMYAEVRKPRADLGPISQDMKKTHFQFGCGAWQGNPGSPSESRSAFRKFLARELDGSHAAASDDAKKELRAAHIRLGSNPVQYESIRTSMDKQGTSGRGDRYPVTVHGSTLTLAHYGCKATPGCKSESHTGFRAFSKEEQHRARGAMNEADEGELRTAHAVLGSDHSRWESSMAQMNRKAGHGLSHQAGDARSLKEKLEGDHIPREAFATEYCTDSSLAHRQFSKKEMAAARGAMSQAGQNDLRAVHLTLGTDACYPYVTNEYTRRQNPYAP